MLRMVEQVFYKLWEDGLELFKGCGLRHYAFNVGVM
jgi:hypothetical protein